jgi:hypothetical protein
MMTEADALSIGSTSLPIVYFRFERLTALQVCSDVGSLGHGTLPIAPRISKA